MSDKLQLVAEVWVKVDPSVVNQFSVVAERRVSLARPFKAGIAATIQVTSRQRRLREYFQPSLTRRISGAGVIPALKGRAKFNRRYAANVTLVQTFFCKACRVAGDKLKFVGHFRPDCGRAGAGLQEKPRPRVRRSSPADA